MNNNFWKNKRVLITGYEGFLGSWLTKMLLKYGANIVGLDILTYRKYTILTKDELARIKVIKGSVESLPLVSDIIINNKTEFIFHLAAKSLVGYCYKNPLRAFSVNIKGTWNILEACRNSKFIKGIIIASSDKAYGNHKNLPYKENLALLGCYPYDVSKSCADLLANAYFHTYKLPVCVTRCGNIYGPGDFNFSRIVPDAIRSMLENKRFIIRSNGKFVRDYIYVDDIVNAYLLLGEKMQKLKLYGEAFNFSNKSPISVLDLVEMIYRITGQAPNYKILNRADYEIVNQYLSAKKAKKLLNFEPKYSPEEGLKRAIHWYDNFLKTIK